MNWQHLKTIAWLRWRLTANQWKKGGSVNAILGLILLVLGLVTAVLSLFVSFVLGILLFPSWSPTTCSSCGMCWCSPSCSFG